MDPKPKVHHRRPPLEIHVSKEHQTLPNFNREPQILVEATNQPLSSNTSTVDTTTAQPSPLIEKKRNPVIHDGCIFLFNSPIFRDIYIRFFKTTSIHLGYKDSTWFYMNHIDQSVFLSELEAFGQFKMSRINEFKEVVQKIVRESMNREPIVVKKETASTIHTVLSQLNFENIPMEKNESTGKKQERFPIEMTWDVIHLMFWVSDMMFKSHYLKHLSDISKKIVLSIPNFVNYHIDIPDYHEMISHTELYEPIALLFSKALSGTEERRTQWKQYQKKEYDRVYNKLMIAISSSIEFTSTQGGIGSNRIRFHVNHYMDQKIKHGPF